MVKLTDETGSIIMDYTYDPFGNGKEVELNAFGINGFNPQATATIDNPFRYSGEYLDQETGNYYLRARYYDPQTQRFINEDSYKGELNNPFSLNSYSYCWNDSVGYTDPSGYMPEWVEKGGKALYASSEIVLGGLTTIGGAAYTYSTGGIGGALGGGFIMTHGTNSIANGVTDFKYILEGDWEEVGKTNYLKDSVYEPVGETLGEGVAILSGGDIQEGREIGEKVGGLAYYIADIRIGVKGTYNAVKELGKAQWTRGYIVTQYSTNGTVMALEGAKSDSYLYMIIGKDGVGYYYDLKGLHQDNTSNEVDVISGAAPTLQ